MPGKRLPRSLREVQMLDAAVVEFARHGFHEASMDDVALRASISKPMLYAYLGTKDDLFVACLHREGTRLMEAIVDVVRVDLAPDEQLWCGLRAFFGHVSANRDGWSVLYRHARGPFAAEWASMRARMIDVVTGMLTRAVTTHGRPRRPTEQPTPTELTPPAEQPALAELPTPTEPITPTTLAELTALAYALVGASESLADWLADNPDESPDVVASRLMNMLWIGAGSSAGWRR